MTQGELGDKAGIHKLTIARFEQGKTEPSWSTVQALAKALGVDCAAFEQKPASRKKAKRGRPKKG
ncbi:MAG: helix-turn-helix transcriptional regulator [Gemmataceae bacterium]|nr:helix-turn-helix transcriptional regulator [Gemmataceae bacterium]MCI0740188.1 helix-turn-helix transcriptional regulator [Gemmataceae bacterium]